MRLESLYRVRFIYPEGWAINITGERGREGQHLYFAEGSVQGRINGRFRASNFPHRRTDNTFTPNFHGVIQTDDDAAILFEYHVYWLLGSSIPKQALQNRERSPSLACKQRRVGVHSEVITRILMHERR